LQILLFASVLMLRLPSGLDTISSSMFEFSRSRGKLSCAYLQEMSHDSTAAAALEQLLYESLVGSGMASYVVLV
jgi:hypothetical protein